VPAASLPLAAVPDGSGLFVPVSPAAGTTTAAGSLLPASSALAKPVMPRTAAPHATTRPLATATRVKRELVFMVGFLLCGVVTGVFPAATTFGLVGHK